MDATLITDLPTAAQRVLAYHLRRSDAASVRAASLQLSSVGADRAGERLWVVANTFQSQSHADARMVADAAMTSSSTQPAAASIALSSEAAQPGVDCTSSSDQGLGPSAQPAYGDLLAATTLRRAAEGVITAEVLVDGSRPCDQQVWQALFSALLSSSTLSDLTITEYMMHDVDKMAGALGNRVIQAHCGIDWSAKGNTQSCTPAVSNPVAANDCAWLPALVGASSIREQQQQQQECGGQQQQQQQQRRRPPPLNLKLQLLAPLPQRSKEFLQLQDLHSLAVLRTPLWLRQQPTEQRVIDLLDIQPVLQIPVLQQLNSLPQLRSLTCAVGGCHNKKPDQVAIMLQSLLQDLGPNLTQLNLGAGQARTYYTHYSLSAPFRHMPALRSLTCNLGVSLDAETDADEAGMRLLEQATRAHSTAQSGGQDGRPVVAGLSCRLFPSLTCLVLVDRASVPDVLERLAQSDAACSQLQHLELPQLMFDEDDEAPDYNEYEANQQQHTDPALATLQLLGRLAGLRQLQAVIYGPWQLSALVAAVGSQLHGLTLTCELGNLRYAPPTPGVPPVSVALQPLFAGVPQLTSLKIIGSTGALLDPSKDLPAAAQHLSRLRSLSYTGGIFALPERGCELLPGMLPATLQGLTIVARQPGIQSVDTDGLYRAHTGCFPQGLTSLKCRGFWWQRPEQVEPWSPWFGWELLPQGLKQLEADAELAMPGGGSGSILPVSAAEGQGGGVLRGEDGTEVSATPATALQCASDSTPYLVALPDLESLALYMTANRLAADAEDPDALSLGALCCQLKGLTRLTNLHISSKLNYRQGDGLSALSKLVGLKVLTLDVGIPAASRDVASGNSLARHFQALVSDLSTHLASHASGLRVLRLPLLSHAGTHATLELEAHLPNCLLVEADDTFVMGGHPQ